MAQRFGPASRANSFDMDKLERERQGGKTMIFPELASDGNSIFAQVGGRTVAYPCK